MNSLARTGDELEAHYDVVIVGSGYGGGVAASRLARTGLRVCVLEKGRQWRPGEFSNTFKGLWDRSRLAGRFVNLGPRNALFDLRVGRQMHVLSACGLGGGSLINAGLAFRPEPWVFDQQKWPREISQDGHLDEGFARAEKMLGVAHCPNGEQFGKYKSLQSCARALAKEREDEELNAQLVPSTINYQPGINGANVMQNACTLCGDCWMGCNVGAKNTVGLTYLADAQQYDASVFTGVEVDFVRKGEKGWHLFYERLDDETGKAAGKGTVRADLLILSAGVLGTNEILMRSRSHGLALSQMLGSGFSANGDDLAFGHDMPDEVNGVAVGHPARTRTTSPVGPNCIGMIALREEEAEPRSEIKLQAGTMITLMAALAPLKSLLRGKPVRALKILFNGAYKGLLTKSQCFYIVGHDDAGGELVLNRDRVVPSWPDVSAQPVFNRARALLTRLFEKTGADYMQNPVRDTILGGRLITVHPLGGCRMGEDVTSGVVDHRHRVFDAAGADRDSVHEGLYIVDGSVIPTSLGANPLLTITALGERAMDLLVRDKGLVTTRKPGKSSPVRDAFM